MLWRLLKTELTYQAMLQAVFKGDCYKHTFSAIWNGFYVIL